MKCQDYNAWLQAQLDGEEHGDQEIVERHLSECPACIALDRTAQRLREGLLAMTPLSLPPDLMKRVVDRVIYDRVRSSRYKAMARVSLAAGVLITVGLAIAWQRIFPRKPTIPAVSDAIVRHENLESPPVTLRDSVAEAGSAVASITSKAADETVGQTRILIPAMTGPSFDIVVATPALEKPTQSLREAGYGVSEGLEPVTDSARRAMGLFLRELPINTGKRPQF